jgi:hypothetical protein
LPVFSQEGGAGSADRIEGFAPSVRSCCLPRRTKLSRIGGIRNANRVVMLADR